MRLLPCALVLLAACKAQQGDFPVNPGGGGGPGGGGRPDAAVDGNDGGGTDLLGRVCLLTDPRDLTLCATTGAGGFTVTLGTAIATTTGDGSFVIPRPVTTNLVWSVTGSTIMTSAMVFGAVPLVPAITQAVYGEMLVNVGVVIVPPGNAGLMARLVRAGAPLVNAQVAGMSNDGGVFAEGTSATTWASTSTGAHGTAWLPLMVTGAATMTVTPAGGTATLVPGIPITDGGITFVTAEIP